MPVLGSTRSGGDRLPCRLHVLCTDAVANSLDYMSRKLCGYNEVWFVNLISSVCAIECHHTYMETMSTESSVMLFEELEYLTCFSIRKFPVISRFLLSLSEVRSLLHYVQRKILKCLFDVYRTSPVWRCSIWQREGWVVLDNHSHAAFRVKSESHTLTGNNWHPESRSGETGHFGNKDSQEFQPSQLWTTCLVNWIQLDQLVCSWCATPRPHSISRQHVLRHWGLYLLRQSYFTACWRFRSYYTTVADTVPGDNPGPIVLPVLMNNALCLKTIYTRTVE